MPTVLSHPALPLALGLALGSATVPARLLAAGVVASVLPDLDVVAFRLGIPYADALGHRGASHSLAFALALGLLAWAGAPALRSRGAVALGFVSVAALSHALLDMLTNGGLGVALAWPASGERFFFSTPVIEVSPLGLRRFFSARGAAVLASELRWVWLPCALGGLALWLLRQVPARLRRAGAQRGGRKSRQP